MRIESKKIAVWLLLFLPVCSQTWSLLLPFYVFKVIYQNNKKLQTVFPLWLAGPAANDGTSQTGNLTFYYTPDLFWKKMVAK